MTVVVLAHSVSSLNAVDWKEINWWKINPTYWLTQTHPAIPKTPVDPTKYLFGVATSNIANSTDSLAQGAESIKEGIAQGAAIFKDPKAIEEASYAGWHGATHGATYGLLSGTASAVRDGVVYVKDTVVAHPVIAGTTVTAGVAAAAYYKFRPLTPEEEHQEKMRKTQRAAELREAALIEKTDLTADELRTCLNTHAHCGDRAKNGIPRRCNSPAGRLAQLNRAVAKEIVDGFKEYR